MDPDQLASLVNSEDPDHYITMIHTVFNARCELVITNQNMKYRIVLTFVLVQGQVNTNFQFVLNEMGPGWTSGAWYFHSPAIIYILKQYYVCLRLPFILKVFSS